MLIRPVLDWHGFHAEVQGLDTATELVDELVL
jgi:hypothetical protein